MSGAIGRGDWVEANEDFHPDYAISRGAVFLCLEVLEPSLCDSESCNYFGPSLALKGLDNSEEGWCAKHWSPIYRPRADLIARLLEPIRESEDA